MCSSTSMRKAEDHKPFGDRASIKFNRCLPQAREYFYG